MIGRCGEVGTSIQQGFTITTNASVMLVTRLNPHTKVASTTHTICRIIRLILYAQSITARHAGNPTTSASHPKNRRRNSTLFSIGLKSISITSNMEIKRITQIHGSYQRLGVFERVAIEQWRVLNPDIEYHFIVDKDIDDFIAEQWPQHMITYNQMMPICRAGVQRLSSVLRWGGLYTDCGSYPLRPIKDFKPEGIWDGDLAMFKLRDREGQPPLVTDCIFAAEKGHPHLRGLIEEIFRRTEDIARKAACVEGEYFNYKKYVFDTASVHVFSDYANANGIKGLDGLADADMHDLLHHTDKVNFLRYSTESWVHKNRWTENDRDRVEEEFNTLNIIKSITGV